MGNREVGIYRISGVFFRVMFFREIEPKTVYKSYANIIFTFSKSNLKIIYARLFKLVKYFRENVAILTLNF